MMPEISLNILDVAENSVRAGAALITIKVLYDTALRSLTVVIEDNGCGMDEETAARVTDPFFTSRKTRDVGLGVPFFKQAAELTGGSFEIKSEKGAGTAVTAMFNTESIDCMPMGDIDSTIHTLITCHQDIEFIYEYGMDGRSFVLDTKEIREILGDVPFDAPEVSQFLMSYLKENREAVQYGDGQLQAD